MNVGTYVDNFADQECFAHFARIRRMTDILERFCAIIARLLE